MRNLSRSAGAVFLIAQLVLVSTATVAVAQSLSPSSGTQPARNQTVEPGGMDAVSNMPCHMMGTQAGQQLSEAQLTQFANEHGITLAQARQMIEQCRQMQGQRTAGSTAQSAMGAAGTSSGGTMGQSGATNQGTNQQPMSQGSMPQGGMMGQGGMMSQGGPNGPGAPGGSSSGQGGMMSQGMQPGGMTAQGQGGTGSSSDMRCAMMMQAAQQMTDDQMEQMARQHGMTKDQFRDMLERCQQAAPAQKTP